MNDRQNLCFKKKALKNYVKVNDFYFLKHIEIWKDLLYVSIVLFSL